MDRREYEGEYRREQRAKANSVTIPKCEDRRRRTRLEKDDCRWLSWYLPDVFSQAWTPTRTELVADIRRAAVEGGLIAAAGTRGAGKTMIAAGVGLKLVLTGRVKVLLLIAATGPFADRLLANIKYWVETSARLAADYPEVVAPIRALEGIAQRCNSQTVAGERTRMLWAGPYVILPTVPKSPASGSVIASLGLDGAIRGFNVRGRRPDLVLVDDPDTRESARSVDQTAKRAEIVENDIAGLGTRENPAAIVMLCNVPTRICLGAQFTDPKIKPAWRGRRYPLVMRWPDRADLWEEYVRRRQEELAGGTNPPRETDRWYLAHRQAMDAGAQLADPDRWNRTLAEDNEPLEVSAIQSVYNLVADRGWQFVSCELQCDPTDEDAADQLSVDVVRSRGNDLPRGQLPQDCARVTIGVDCGKFALHWVAVAWSEACRASVIDYGIHDVAGTSAEDSQGIEFALCQSVQSLIRERCLNVAERQVDHVLVDSGYYPAAIYAAVKACGGGRVGACKGAGDVQGPAERMPVKSGREARVGDHWALRYQSADRIWLTLIDSDYWKQWIRDRITTAPGYPGSMTLFSPDRQRYGDHRAFAEHLAAEQWDPVKHRWIATKRNHWGDALYYAAVAASITGIRLLTQRALPVSWREQQKERTRHGKTKTDRH